MAIISSLLEEGALVVIVLWGLPQIEIHIPLAGLIALMIAMGAYDVFAYRMGTKALMRKPVTGLPEMLDSKGKTVIPLDPEGLVKIKGELWAAESVDRKIDAGKEVIVVGQERLKLLVRKNSTSGVKRA